MKRYRVLFIMFSVSFLLHIVSETLTCFCKQKISHFNSLSLFFVNFINFFELEDTQK